MDAIFRFTSDSGFDFRFGLDMVLPYAIKKKKKKIYIILG